MAVETTYRDAIKAAVVAALPDAVVTASYREPSTDLSSMTKNVVYAWVWPIEKVRSGYRGVADNRYVFGVQVIKKLTIGTARDAEVEDMLTTMDTLEDALAETEGVLNFDDDETGRLIYDHEALAEQNAFVATLRPVAVGVA